MHQAIIFDYLRLVYYFFQNNDVAKATRILF